MSSIEEQLSEQFYEWEERGRGWQVWEEPVSPEPPFRPFYGHLVTPQPSVDDGRKPTFLSSLISRLSHGLAGAKEPEPLVEDEEEEPQPDRLERGELVELHASLPPSSTVSREVFEQFALSLAHCHEPIAFELIGTPDSITAQLVMAEADADLVRHQLEAHFPEAVCTRQDSFLETKWNEAETEETLIFELGLSREFLFQIATARSFNIDPFIGLTAALSHLRDHELALFQVLFEPVRHDWSESILRSVTDSSGKDFFVNRPELAGEAKKKIARPLFAAVVRLAVKSNDRLLDIAKNLGGALTVFSNPGGNEFVPLDNSQYRFPEHEEDVLRRQSRRSGMILNCEELVSLVHLPSSSVRAPKLKRETQKSKAAPKLALNARGLLLGINSHAGVAREVRLSSEERVRHMHVLGASGTGKSTLLFNLILQDIRNGEGVAVLDPHGDLVERILGVIPPERIKDVVLLDPTDEAYSIGFNILSAHSDFEKNLLASDLVSVFRRLSTSWGDQMGSVLNNAILAFLESSRGGTLADVRRFLLDAEFRAEFLATVTDPDIVYYWRKGFPQLGGNKSIGPILTRLDTFLSPKPIRYMVSQRENRLDFADILDSGKIFLAKLPQGQMGKENSFLLGSLLVAKFQQLAMSRQRLSAEQRRDFWLYIDEFHCFITPSMAEILSGARKYRLGLVLAHHELHQLQRDSDVASAVLSHPYTRLVFRVGDADAHALEKGFASFEARDLQNLAIGEAIGRLEKSDGDFNLSIPLPKEPDPRQAADTREKVITASREKYGKARSEIEAALLRTVEKEPVVKPAPVVPPKARPEAPPPPALEVPLAPVSVVLPDPAASEPVTVAAPTAEAEKSRPAAPPDMGIGGAQHQAIQKRLKEEAEILGFRATIEKPIPEGSVDLLLEKAGQAIACEISVTTTIDHEFRNVTKCLQAGFSHVAVVSRPERLRQIAEAVITALGQEKAARVGYYSPDDLIAYLRSLAVETPVPVPAIPTETLRRGRRVKVKSAELTSEERQAKESAYLKLISETMRKKPQ